MNAMKVESVYNHADYRLMSRHVIDQLRKFNEVHLFLRALIPLIGFPSTTVYYDRKERAAGESKYPLSKMLAFAWNGISSFSGRPLRYITIMGLLVFMLSLAGIIISIIFKIAGSTLPGWTSLMIPILFLGGLQLFSLGIIGEYIGKIFEEVKQRPRFIIERYVNDTK
jgi:glycosyltransferase involved in cell wall biosynthesis